MIAFLRKFIWKASIGLIGLCVEINVDGKHFRRLSDLRTNYFKYPLEFANGAIFLH